MALALVFHEPQQKVHLLYSGVQTEARDPVRSLQSSVCRDVRDRKIEKIMFTFERESPILSRVYFTQWWW